MDIIIVDSRQGQMRRFTLRWHGPVLWLPPLLLLLLALGGAGWLGYQLRPAAPALPTELLASWLQEAEAQRLELEETRRRAGEEARALARRVALLQAQVMRLEAAGERLGVAAGLDVAAFDFAAPVAVGGPEAEVGGAETGYGDVVASLAAVEQRLVERERQLQVLEDLLLAGRLQQELKPSGWPVATGWISSLFGYRTDPFTGRRAIHEGVDFAAQEGTEIYSVGAGIVSFSGRRGTYGNMVEINHGNGYVTRYSHNERNLVKEGERVYKGQVIATMGQTGRATGPHLHFEVLYNGRVVNPERYIQAAR